MLTVVVQPLPSITLSVYVPPVNELKVDEVVLVKVVVVYEDPVKV